MKHLFSPLTKLFAVAACALTLGSCNRAEYAMLPKSSSYHGVARVAAPVPAAPAATVVTTPAAEKAVVATAPSVATVTPAPTPVVAPAVATAPARMEKAAPVVAAVPAAATIVAQAAPRKLNLMQRLAVAKVTRKLEKVAQKATSDRHSNAASTQRLDGKLRQGLILLVVGLLIGIVGGAVGGTIGGIIALLGLILVIIGVVLVILYLLDSL